MARFRVSTTTGLSLPGGSTGKAVHLHGLLVRPRSLTHPQPNLFHILWLPPVGFPLPFLHGSNLQPSQVLAQSVAHQRGSAAFRKPRCPIHRLQQFLIENNFGGLHRNI